MDDRRMHRLSRRLAAAMGRPSVKHRVIERLGLLTPDHWLPRNLDALRTGAAGGATWLDLTTALAWWARAMQPRDVLEIGVRRGRSMAVVLGEAPAARVTGVDLWIEDYGSRPELGIHAGNPGPGFVRAELRRAGIDADPNLIRGDSAAVLPRLRDEGATFDLITVDGDHGEAGATRDLEHAAAMLRPGGCLLFDDIAHPSHPELAEVWRRFRAARPQWLFVEDDHRAGTGVAVRPPLGALAARLDAATDAALDAERAGYAFDSEPIEQRFVRSVVEPGMTVVDVGAHRGKYARLLSLLVGERGRVLALEPCPASRRALAERIVRESMDNVTLVASAASERAGRAVLTEYAEPCSSWSGLGTPTMADPADPGRTMPPLGRVVVATERLDDVLERHGLEHVDYLKLDVEGAEALAVDGLARSLRARRIDRIQFEVSRAMLDGMGVRAGAVFDRLADLGYRVHELRPGGGLGAVRADSDAFFENLVAVPERRRGRTIRPAAAGAAPAAVRGAGADLLPLHLFTIVLNGRPFLEHHVEAFRRLRGPWHWHVIEGVAELVGDTAWSVPGGGHVPEDLHRGGLSIDGTTEALDAIADRLPGHVTIHRPPAGRRWRGKLEMVRRPLAAIDGPALLWQVDVDELWTTEQLEIGRRLFLEHPEARAARYRCHYFIGPELVVRTRDTYGNHDGEWLRTWRVGPGCDWAAHEPPRLLGPGPDGRMVDLAGLGCLPHAVTESAGLVFQHLAYASESQIAFKERYYGYARATEQWRRLVARGDEPARLRAHLDWIHDEAVAVPAAALGVRPLVDARIGPPAAGTPAPEPAPRHVLVVRTDSIGDGVLFGGALEQLRAAWPATRITLACRDSVRRLWDACPCVDEVVGLDIAAAREDECARVAIVDHLRGLVPDLVLNLVFSREPVSESIIEGLEPVRRVGLVGDDSNLPPEARRRFDRRYDRLIPSSPDARTEPDHHRDLLAGLLGEVPGPVRPRIWTHEHDETSAERMFAALGLDPGRTIVLMPGAQYRIKVHPGLAEAVAGLEDHDVLILGAGGDRPLCKRARVTLEMAEMNARIGELLGRAPGDGHDRRIVDLTGRTTIGRAAALVRRCRLLVGNDSAGAHIAAAVGTPSVVVVGGGHLGRFLPTEPGTTAVVRPLDCQGCNWQCPHRRPHCVTDVPVEAIRAAIERALEHPPARPRVVLAAAGRITRDRDDPTRVPLPIDDVLPGWLTDRCEVIDAPRRRGRLRLARTG